MIAMGGIGRLARAACSHTGCGISRRKPPGPAREGLFFQEGDASRSQQ